MSTFAEPAGPGRVAPASAMSAASSPAASSPATSSSIGPSPAATLALALAALVVVAAGLAAAAALWALVGGAPTPPPARNPFGVGVREAAPAATGFGAWLIAAQAAFWGGMTGALRSLNAGEGTLAPLLGAAFLYGVVHAAGPGHGKAVVSAYVLATERELKRGLVLGAGLSLASALVQAALALGLVLGLTAIVSLNAREVTLAAERVEVASFAVLAGIGLWLTLTRARALLRTRVEGVAADHVCGPACGHGPVAPGRAASWRERFGIAVAGGLRPCTGAILLLVVTASQGRIEAGVLGVLAIAAGVSVTTSAIAALAVFAKRAALALAGGRPARGETMAGGLALLASAFVAVLGLGLLFGVGFARGAG